MRAVERRGAEARPAGGFVPEVPDHPVQPGPAAALERSHDLSGGIHDLDRDPVGLIFGEPVVDRRAVGRVLPGARILGLAHRTRPHPETPRFPGGEEVRPGALHPIRPLPDRGDVVEDPESAAVGRGDQVRKALLDRQPVDRGVGQVRLQGLERPAVVEGDVHRVLRPQEQQAGAHRVLPDGVGVAVGVLREVLPEPAPARAEVPGLVGVGVRVADLVEIHRHVGRAGRVPGGLDVAVGAERRESGQVRRDVLPRFARIPGDVNPAVVAPRPEHAGRVG